MVLDRFCHCSQLFAEKVDLLAPHYQFHHIFCRAIFGNGVLGTHLLNIKRLKSFTDFGRVIYVEVEYDHLCWLIAQTETYKAFAFFKSPQLPLLEGSQGTYTGRGHLQGDKMIKRTTVLAVALLGISASAHADQTITIPGTLPNAETCEKAWTGANSPEAAASIFIAALITYQFDQATARDCMTRIVDANYLSNGKLSHDIEYLIEVGIDRHSEIARSYVGDAVPDNGYTLPETKWNIHFTRDQRFDLGNQQYRVKVYTSGQPSSRPITMRRDGKGHYRINEASTLFVGVAAPR